MTIGETHPDKRSQELIDSTTALIRTMARVGFTELMQRPHFVGPGSGLSKDANILGRRSIVDRVTDVAIVAPRSYQAPRIEGFGDGIFVESTELDSDRLAINVVGAKLHLPSRHDRRIVAVTLRKEHDVEPLQASRGDKWRSPRRYAIADDGQAGFSPGRGVGYGGGLGLPRSLAVAGLVAHAVKQAHGIDIGTVPAEELYSAWLSHEQNVQVIQPPQQEQPYWSTLLYAPEQQQQ
jgi:hypothetical protein